MAKLGNGLPDGEKNWTKQSEVEEKADLSYKYLSNIERSVSIPSLEVIMRLAAAL